MTHVSEFVAREAQKKCFYVETFLNMNLLRGGTLETFFNENLLLTISSNANLDSIRFLSASSNWIFSHCIWNSYYHHWRTFFNWSSAQ
jgi:hypothetical protein